MKCSPQFGPVYVRVFLPDQKRHRAFCICYFPLCLADHFRRRITISKLVKHARAFTSPPHQPRDEMSLADFCLFYFSLFPRPRPDWWNLRVKKHFARHQLSLTANSRSYPRESQRESQMKMRHAGSIFFPPP